MKWSTVLEDERYVKSSPQEKKLIKEDWYKNTIVNNPDYQSELDTQIRQDIFGKEKPFLREAAEKISPIVKEVAKRSIIPPITPETAMDIGKAVKPVLTSSNIIKEGIKPLTEPYRSTLWALKHPKRAVTGLEVGLKLAPPTAAPFLIENIISSAGEKIQERAPLKEVFKAVPEGIKGYVKDIWDKARFMAGDKPNVDTQEIAGYGQIYGTYYKSIVGQEAPEWYTATAGLAQFIGLSPTSSEFRKIIKTAIGKPVNIIKETTEYAATKISGKVEAVKLKADFVNKFKVKLGEKQARVFANELEKVISEGAPKQAITPDYLAKRLFGIERPGIEVKAEAVKPTIKALPTKPTPPVEPTSEAGRFARKTYRRAARAGIPVTPEPIKPTIVAPKTTIPVKPTLTPSKGGEIDVSKMSKAQKIKQRDLELKAIDEKIRKAEEKLSPSKGGEVVVLENPMPVTKKALNGYSSPQFKTEEEATQWMIDRGFKKEWIKISKGRTTTVSTGEFREYYYANPNRNYIDEIIEKGKELAHPTPSKGGEIALAEEAKKYKSAEEFVRGFKQFSEANKQAIKISEKYADKKIDVYGSFATLKRRGSGKKTPDLDIIVDDKSISEDILNFPANKELVKKDIAYAKRFNETVREDEPERIIKNVYDQVGRLDIPEKYQDLSHKAIDAKVKITFPDGHTAWYGIKPDGTLRRIEEALQKEQLQVGRKPLKQALTDFYNKATAKPSLKAHIMPSGEVMQGAEHPGAVVGSEFEAKPKTPKAYYSIGPEDYDNVMQGKSIGKMGEGKKVIPPESATGKPIQWEQNTAWQVNLGRNIPGAFEREIGPKLQVSKRFKRYLGAYYSMLGKSGTIKIRSIADEKTLTHETGHFLDDVLGKYYIERKKAVRAELKKVSQFLHPFDPTTAKPAYLAYRHSRTELFAEYVAAYTTHPAKAKELAPNFTARVEAEIAKDKEFKYVIDKLREFEKEFKPIKDYVNALRKIPEIQPELKVWKEQGNLLQNLWRTYIGDKIYFKYTSMIDKLGQKPVLREMFEKGGMQDQVFEILRQRKKLIDGQRAKFNEDIIKPMTKMTKEDQQYIAETLQRFDLAGKTNTEIDLLTEQARREIAVWGNEARKLGLLNDEVFWNNVGQYFPYFYETKEFAQNQKAFGFFPAKKIKANLSGLKHKLTDEQMGKRVLEAKLGTWPKAKAQIARVSKEELERLGRQARIDMGLIKTAAFPLQKRISQMIEAIYTVKAFNLIAKLPGIVGTKDTPGFVKLPDTKKFGNIAGEFVPENIAKEVNSWSKIPGDMENVIQSINSVWKNLKVPYSPKAMFRNLITNQVMAWMGDIPIWNPVVTLKGAWSFIRNDAIAKELRAHGLYKHTYSQEELSKLAFMVEKDPENPFEQILQYAVKAFQKPAELYGFMEDMSKTIIANYVVKKGGSIPQAVKFADKLLFDYSSVSKLVGIARQGPFPFITWSAKVLPRLIEFAFRKPEKYFFIYLALAIGSEMARRKLGITKEEEEKLKPDYIKKQPVLLMPFRDVNGDLNWIDFTYMVPWSGWMPMEKGKLAVPQTLTAGSPIVIMYNAFVLNYDPWYGEIAPDYLSNEMALDAKAKYLREGLGPDILTRTPTKIIKAVKGISDQYNRKPELGKVLAGEIAGIKFVRDMSSYRGKIKKRVRYNYSLGRRAIQRKFERGEITSQERKKFLIKQREKYRKERKIY